MLNQIGAYACVTLEGPFLAIGEQPIVMERPGVDGTAVWRTGLRGREFKAISGVDGLNVAQIRALYLEYRALIGTFVDLIWMGMPMSDAANKYIVLNVEPTVQEPLVLGIGGFWNPAYAWLECEWTLKLVESA